MFPPVIFIIAQPGIVAFFKEELSSQGYVIFGKTTAREALRYLVIKPHLVLIFDHFIENEPDIVQLCCKLHTRLAASTPMLVVTDRTTRDLIAPFTTTTYDYIGGVGAVIAHIQAVLPISTKL